MCYSAEVQEDYRWYIRTFGAKITACQYRKLNRSLSIGWRYDRQPLKIQRQRCSRQEPLGLGRPA